MQAPLSPANSRTSRAELDRTVGRLRAHAGRFARLDVREKLSLLSNVSDRYFALLDDMVEAACVAKGLAPGTEESGEEWLAHGYAMGRYLRLLKQSLQDVAERGRPHFDPDRLRRRPGGSLALRVYPASTLEAVTFPGITAEVHFQAGLPQEEVLERQAAFYRRPHDGRVALVLGAGNVNALPPKDALHKMFVEGAVAVLKMNPVNEYLGPYLERAFAPAIDEGYFAVVYGDAEVGSYLAHHADVDEIHITGSDRTHDAIVWGPPGPERDERMARNDPVLKKQITSELGNISSVLVVPGPWTPADLAYHARNVAGMVANNGSFNCVAAKLLVTGEGWRQTGPLLAAVEHALAQIPPRKAYYPGAADRFESFTANRGFLRKVGLARAGELPWAILPHLDAQSESEPLFRTEPWCSVVGQTAIASDDPVDFLEKGVRFLNERVWGTLNAMVLVHPETQRDPAVAAALEKAIDGLRYGTVAVNVWSGAGFVLGVTPWGSHPSTSLHDIQSGRGWSGNSLMLEGVEKTVVRAPFKMFPKPPWFPDHKRPGSLARRVTMMERDRSWRKLPAVALSAMRG